MDKIISILQSIRERVDYENEKHLVDDGILDSLDIAVLVNELNNEFGIKLGTLDLEPKNFNSVEAMEALIQKRSIK